MLAGAPALIVRKPAEVGCAHRAVLRQMQRTKCRCRKALCWAFHVTGADTHMRCDMCLQETAKDHQLVSLIGSSHSLMQLEGLVWEHRSAMKNTHIRIALLQLSHLHIQYDPKAGDYNTTAERLERHLQGMMMVPAMHPEQTWATSPLLSC